MGVLILQHAVARRVVPGAPDPDPLLRADRPQHPSHFARPAPVLSLVQHGWARDLQAPRVRPVCLPRVRADPAPPGALGWPVRGLRAGPGSLSLAVVPQPCASGAATDLAGTLLAMVRPALLGGARGGARDCAHPADAHRLRLCP